MLRRYLTVVGIILVVVIGLGVWLKPSLAGMREGIEEGVAEFAAAHMAAGEAAPAITAWDTHDWYIATTATARVGEHAFACWGAYKVTVCNFPK